LIAILGFHTTYSQYPIIKKIKQDSVIILTVKQGEQINNLYKRYNDTIGLLKDSLGIKTYKYDSVFNKLLIQKDSISFYKGRSTGIKQIGVEEIISKIEREKEVNRMWLFFLFAGTILAITQK
jgi:hypothetical protein